MGRDLKMEIQIIIENVDRNVYGKWEQKWEIGIKKKNKTTISFRQIEKGVNYFCETNCLKESAANVITIFKIKTIFNHINLTKK